MKLLKELVESLSSSRAEVTEALLQTKVLLHRLGRKDLAEWVNFELTGYPASIEVPNYRTARALVMGSVTNGFHGYNRHPLPTLDLEEWVRKRVQDIEIRDSISVLEGMAKKESKGWMRQIPVEFNAHFNKLLTNDYFVQRAWSEFGTGCFAEIETQVRSRLLDFLLELDEKVSEDMSDAEVKKIGQSSDTSSMFNNAIFGDNATIVVGDNNRQTVSNKIERGNIEELLSAFRSAKLPEESVQELRVAIEEDEVQQQKAVSEFGPKVKQWMKSALGRVVDNSWQIEMNIAANLMTDVLKAFYGI